jgi:hypothetical protein
LIPPRLFAHCGLVCGMAPIDAPGLRVRTVAFLSILLSANVQY